MIWGGGGLIADETANKYWNSVKVRSVWSSALTRMLTRNLPVNVEGSVQIDGEVFRGKGEGYEVL